MDPSMIIALTVCPAMLGIQEAIRQSQSKNKREEHRARRCNLIVQCVKSSIRSREINSRLVVLKDNKLYIDTGTILDDDHTSVKPYPFSGYYLPYPEASYEGLVSTISDDPPMLNWIYIDRETYEVKYGVRADAQTNLTGPFDCTRQDRRLTFESWEGFCAAEEYPGVWALYFDRDDDGLKSKVPFGTRVLEVELTRREKKVPVPEGGATTLDELMKEQQAQSSKPDLPAETKSAEQDADLASEGADSLAPLREADLAKLNLAVGSGRDAAGGSVLDSPTDGRSVWSALDKRPQTPATSVQGYDADVEMGEKDPRYQRPYVEEER